jgi:hypothetical protein
MAAAIASVAIRARRGVLGRAAGGPAAGAAATPDAGLPHSAKRFDVSVIVSYRPALWAA